MTLAKRRQQHYRLGHRNYRDIAKICSKHIVDNISIDDDLPFEGLNGLSTDVLDCESCSLGKAKRRPFPLTRKPRDYEIVERIVFDTCGPLPVCSLYGERYFVTFSDDKSRYKFTYLLTHKSEALDALSV